MFFLVEIRKNQQMIENLWIFFFVENHARSREVSGTKKSGSQRFDCIGIQIQKFP